MENKKIIQELEIIISSKGLKKSEVESKIGLPQNSLSNFLSEKKELPSKWLNPIRSFIDSFKVESQLEPITQNKPKPIIEKTLEDKAALGRIRIDNEKINKDFGEGTVVVFGDLDYKGYGIIPTGSIQLDHALGIGGLPRGRMVEIFGNESCGKTTIALSIIAQAQKMGLKCLLIDAENAFDPEYASALGVKTDELIYNLPTHGEEGLEVADRKICSGEFGVVVIDSVAALVPKGELEAQMGDSKMGLHARLMSQACRKMVGSVGKTNTLCIFINQIRHKIGVQYWESPEVTTGGRALQFYASVRLEVKRSTTKDNSVMNGDVKEGNLTTVKVVKNKCAPPFRQAQFNILYGKGIDTLSEVVELSIELKIIEKSGSWYSYQDAKLGQGKESVLEILENHPEMQLEIINKIKNFKA